MIVVLAVLGLLLPFSRAQTCRAQTYKDELDRFADDIIHCGEKCAAPGRAGYPSQSECMMQCNEDAENLNMAQIYACWAAEFEQENGFPPSAPLSENAKPGSDGEEKLAQFAGDNDLRSWGAALRTLQHVLPVPKPTQSKPKPTPTIKE